MALTREDDAYFMPPHAPRQLSLSSPHVKWVGDGISVRDWYAAPVELTLFPYTQDGAKAYAAQSAMRRLWKYRRHLEVRRALSGTQADRGLTWYEYSDWHPDRWQAPSRLAFAFVA